MSWLGRFLIAGILVSCLAIAAVAGTIYSVLSPAGTDIEKIMLIRPGMTLYQVSQELEAKKMLKDARAFRLWAQFKGLQNKMQTGYFKLNGKMSAPDILAKLTSGDSEKIPYTIPEGYRIDQAAKKLDDYELSSKRYIELARKPDAELLKDYPFLLEGSGSKSLEGYLYPDTYHLAGSERALISAQLHQFKTQMLPVWQNRPANHPLDFDKTVKLASIVELEGLVNRELPIIAGVFLKRMKIGMKLESDPTTEYALGWHQGAKGLSLKDIAIDSPYNTYRYHGLPPTPIGNPSLDAFKAVLYPTKTDYLYFVAKGDGTHQFSKTYPEHLAAIRRIWAAKKAG